MRNGAKMTTRFVLISDTHNHKPVLPDGDILLHTGDFTMSGSQRETQEAMVWLGVQALKFRSVVITGGNHDWFLYHLSKETSPSAVRAFVQKWAGKNVYYLEDEMMNVPLNDGSPCVIYGSPVQPEFGGWAWNQTRGAEIKATWDKIPSYHPLLSIDVLMTHGPAKNILDWIGKDRVGCEELREALDRVRPKLHVFGHIHCAYGKARTFHGNNPCVECYNAAMCGEAAGRPSYPLDPKHKPWVLDYDGKTFVEAQ